MKAKLFKNKKGSILVERILMVAFSVAAGGAVVVYGANVINDSKNTQITGILDGATGNSDVTYYNNEYKITLSPYILNGSTWGNLKDELPLHNPFVSIKYGNDVCTLNEWMHNQGEMPQFTYYVKNYVITFIFDNYNGDYMDDESFYIYDKTAGEYITFTKSLTIETTEEDYPIICNAFHEDTGVSNQ